MKILGVDPGLTRCGVGVITFEKDRTLSLISVDVFQSSKEHSTPERLLQLQRYIETSIELHQPDRIAVERVFAQHNLRTVMGTAQASAVVFLSAAQRNIPIEMHTPSEVKASVTGSGRANKAQIAHMVTRLLSLPDQKFLPDATDALALAICNAWRGDALSGQSGQLTPAQKRWREAERQSKKRG